jgi:hypothetical protein
MNSKCKQINLLFIFSVPAPYVVARLTALGANGKFNIFVIFMSNTSSTYSWEMSSSIPGLQSTFIIVNKKIKRFINFFYIVKLFHC